MEGEKYRTCVDPALGVLKRLHDELPRHSDLKDPIMTAKLDLRFFKLFFWGLEYRDHEAEKDLHVLSVLRTLSSEIRQTAMKYLKGNEKNLQMSSHFEKIEQSKAQVRESCIHLFGDRFKCKSSKYEKFSEYARDKVDFIFFTFKNLEILNSTVHLTATVKRQIWFIVRKLKLFGNFVDLVSQWMIGDKLEEFLLHTQIWANHMSCLACLYWTDGMNDSLECSMEIMPSYLMQKIMPCSPEAIGLAFDVLKTTRYQKFKSIGRHELDLLGARYVDFLLKNLTIPMKREVEIFREGLIFLLTFMMNPPDVSQDPDRVCREIDAIMSLVPSVICSLHLNEMLQEIRMPTTMFSELLERIGKVKAEVRDVYVLTTHSLQPDCPRTNALGFLDFLLENLKKMLEVRVNFIHSVVQRVEIIRRELASLRPFLQSIVELQHEHEESKDLWTQITNVVYNADYATKLTSVVDVPVWYSIIWLSKVIKDVKLIKIEVKKIQDHKVYEDKNFNDEIEPSGALLPQVMTSNTEVFIGFKEDAKSIMDQLVRGRKDLTIISISGMPGQGKTTLAKKIYNDHSIQYHFHETVWCNVSKECKTREFMIEIVSALTKVDVEKILKLEIHDLAESLRKSLKGKRYLIVMDDIWDVDVWREVQISFPDDSNGSRILFTSRNHNLVTEAKLNSISHPLPLFSDEESWELMKVKLFSSYSGAPEFLEIGKQIAIYCKGLPVAVVLIAALLGRTEQKLDLWSKVAQNLKSHLASEGCMHIIELSYKYLPDHLKPCFLYFGAFPRGLDIRARKLKQLWISEGFIKENADQCAEDLAKEYLDYLVCQNLVVVSERSSMGGIKTCNVHDLLYDLCLQKAAEENFLHWADTRAVVQQCLAGPRKYNHYRFCIGNSDPLAKQRHISTSKELPCSSVHSILWSRHDSWTPIHSFFEFSPFLESFKILTVLDLEDLLFTLHEIPKVIMSLVHLTYIALGATYIDEIPSSITDLWNLETLTVREPRSGVMLPGTMWSMKSLKHVNISLCRLYFEQNKFSTINLETLSAPILIYDGKTKEFLERSPKLRKLYCHFGEDFSATWFSMFKSLNKLESLRISYVGWFSRDINYDKFPGFKFPWNLKKLTLSGFRLPWSTMSIIGKMPNLEVLKLLHLACQGTKWDLEDGEFSKLIYLKLCGLDIEQLNASSDSFPCLEELVVDQCYSLEEIPSSIGDICTLKIIRVLRSSYKASNSVRQVLEQQQDMGNHSLQVYAPNVFDIDDGDEKEMTRVLNWPWKQ